MLHDAHAKCSPNLTADGLTSQCYLVHVICEMWAHWLHSSRLPCTSSYLLVYQDGCHAQKCCGVMQTYVIFIMWWKRS